MAKLCVGPPKVFEVEERARGPLSHAKFDGARISPAARRPKPLSFLTVCLFSVCLSVTLLKVRDCAPDVSMKALEYRNDFDTVGWGKVCSCAPVFSFLRLPPTSDTTKCRRLKNAKIRDFSPPEGDIINQLRQNLARKRIPCVCSSTPHLVLGEGDGYRSPPQISKYANNCV